MSNYSIEQSMRTFLNVVKSHNIVNMDDEAQQKLITELKRCIQFDIEIQQLIQIADNTKFNFNNKNIEAYVSLVRLHNIFIPEEDDKNNLEGIHLDNMGLYTFEFLENKSKESYIYIPKRKTKLDKWNIKEVNTDKLLKEFDNTYYKINRFSPGNEQEKKDRASLSPKQIDLLKGKESNSFNKYYDFISKKYPRTVDKNTKNQKYLTAWYTPISCANVMSFLLFYNRPFKLPYHLFNDEDDAIEKSLKKLKIKNKKITTNNAVRALLYNIMFFIDDKHLKKYSKERDYHRAIYIDKVLFLAKIDYLYNWILFSSCFSDCSLYLKNETQNTFDADYANEYLMNETSYPNKKKDKAVNYLFFTKWYLLALAKFVKYYNNSDFIELVDSVNAYYEEIFQDTDQSKEYLLSDLYQSKELLDFIIVDNMKKESEVNFSLLIKLSSIFSKKIKQSVKIKKLDEFVNTFSSLLNSNFETANMDFFKLELCKYILKDINLHIELYNDPTPKINQEFILKYLKNRNVRSWIDDSLDYVEEDMIENLCKNEFEKVLVKELIETVRYDLSRLDDLIREYYENATS